jgi:hypothetical protein
MTDDARNHEREEWTINSDNIELVLKLLRLFKLDFVAEVSEEVTAFILGP